MNEGSGHIPDGRKIQNMESGKMQLNCFYLFVFPALYNGFSEISDITANFHSPK